jgi:hypothetical protein
MSRSKVNAFLVVYLVVLWAAVALRVDRFPLTWAPMYSTYAPKDTVSVKIVEGKKMDRGLQATRADGSEVLLDRKDLNLPKLSFWRIYYQRMNAQGPIKHKQGNMNLSDFNRWWRGLDVGEKNFEADWPRRLIGSVNRTLGHAPGDPEFIVRLEVVQKRRYYDADDLSNTWEKDKHYVALWNEAWQIDWDDGHR